MNNIRRSLTVAAAVLGGGAALSAAWPGVPYAQLAKEIESGQDHISAIETGEMIMRGDTGIRIFDLRSEAEFEEAHIPGAVQSTVVTLLKMDLSHDIPIVIYSAGGAHAAQAWTLLRLQGFRKVYFLREGVYEWTATVVNPQLASDATPVERAAFERARTLSRFFGGFPATEVSRAAMRRGYWTGSPNDGATSREVEFADSPVASRRRGC